MSTVCLTETSTLPRNDQYTLAELEPGEVEETVYHNLVDFGLPSHEHGLGDTIRSGLSLERPLQRDVESSARSSRALRDDTTELEEGEAAESPTTTTSDSQSYFIDLTPDHAKNPRDASAPWVQIYGVYTRDSETILGDTISTDSHGDSTSNSNTNRCFNCGSPEHAVSSCPIPRNRELIALSRQYYNFFQESRGDFQRIHVIEAWRQQRLTWLEHFDPGEIRGELLRDAIGTDGQEGPEWLANMALWGYPKGWAGTDDPRHEVYRRISNDAIGFTADDVDSVDFGTFHIYGDSAEAEAEHVDFHDDDDFPTLNDGNLESASASSSASDTELSNDRTPSPPPPKPHTRRWAQYPSTHFSSQLLPIYNGIALPAISSSYNDDRQKLWERIVSGSGETRLPPPPPPTSEPPPLPPPHPSLPPRPPPPPPTSEPPPLPPAHPSLPPRPMPPEYECRPMKGGSLDEGQEVDMDMSDSE